MQDDKTRSNDHDQNQRQTPQQDQAQSEQQDMAKRESGLPGGGQGRRDEVGPTGVHPMSAGVDPNRHAEIRTLASWGQGERGAEGYNDAGGSELVMREGQLLGGLTAGPGGEPTIDIHGGDLPPNMKNVKGDPPTSEDTPRPPKNKKQNKKQNKNQGKRR